MEIRNVTIQDIEELHEVVIESFLVPHGHAAPKEYIDNYIARNFSKEALEKEISDSKNVYRVLMYENKLVGFSKIIFNYKNENIQDKNVTKMERIYLLKEYYGLGLGKQLFQFNADLAKRNNQKGMWLHVWIENKRALQFYQKMGMTSVGHYDFHVSENHYNANYVMYLEF